jgi:hypothetical protein
LASLECGRSAKRCGLLGCLPRWKAAVLDWPVDNDSAPSDIAMYKPIRRDF